MPTDIETSQTNPLHSLAATRVRVQKRRNDIAVHAVTLGPRHRFPHLPDWRIENFGDLSITVEYSYASSPDRRRIEVYNIRTSELPEAFWTLVNHTLND